MSEITVHPITPDLVRAMNEANAADHGHCAPFATHVFVKDGQVVGAVALFAQCLTFWAQSTKLSKREAVTMAQQARDMGLKYLPNFLIACSPDSPYQPLMEGLGFRRVGNADFFEVANVQPPKPSQ